MHVRRPAISLEIVGKVHIRRQDEGGPRIRCDTGAWVRPQGHPYSGTNRLRAFRLLCVLTLAWFVPLFLNAQQSVARPRIGVALEGGGALGLAHIGVLEFLDANHIPVDYVAGTSMGGLVGGFYAMGKRPTEIQKLISEINWDRVLRGQVPYRELAFRRKEDKRAYPNRLELGLRHGLSVPGGLNSGQEVDFILDRETLPYYNLNSFDELPTPFRCIATDLSTGTAHVFKDGSLSAALRSTMSLPAIFSPFRNGAAVYADGGLLNNLPVDVVRAMGADIVIAVYLKNKPYDPKASQSLFGVLGRSVSVMIAANERRNMEAADILITVDLSKYTAIDYAAAPTIADQGYEGAKRKAPLLARLKVDEALWKQYLADRESKRITSLPTPSFVKVTGITDSSSGRIERAFAEDLGKPINEQVIERRINRIAGLGRYSSLGYDLVDEDGKTGLLVRVEEKENSLPFSTPASSWTAPTTTTLALVWAVG